MYGGKMGGWTRAVSLCCSPPAPQLPACFLLPQTPPPLRPLLQWASTKECRREAKYSPFPVSVLASLQSQPAMFRPHLVHRSMSMALAQLSGYRGWHRLLLANAQLYLIEVCKQACDGNWQNPLQLSLPECSLSCCSCATLTAVGAVKNYLDLQRHSWFRVALRTSRTCV